ncbi:MAG: hypothetical protein L0Y36_10180 [Planctomycetales bacterium]|nr:hypothetical protein [Planctomycetales bacterium]
MAVARQPSQSNTMLYAVITFVALFIIATVFAVVYYVKSEEYRTQAELAKDDLNAVANPAEKGTLARIVGKPEEGRSYLGTLQKVADDLYSFIIGQPPSTDVPATVKFNEISMAIDSLNKNVLVLGQDVNPAVGLNGVGLLKTIEDLKQKLENTRAEVANLQGINDTLQLDLADAAAKAEQERQKFVAELDQFQTQADQIRNRFDSLQQNMQDSTAEQVKTFQDKLEEEQARLRQKQLDLQETEKKLGESDTLLKDAMTKLEAIKPKPDREVQAYQPDAQIVRVDLQSGIVYLDAGISDHVYRGLTFAIYDRNKPILEEGQNKAEIEVFQVAEQVCAARIIKSDKKNPVVMEDLVVNLIWDRKGANQFVVAGEFDFNNDGRIDADGTQRIKELIERWGGRVTEAVTVDTDFLVLGAEPASPPRPTQDELDIDPMSQQRYELSNQKAKAYTELLDKATNLGIPVFNQKRFMYLIGYDTLLTKNPTP